MKYFWTATPESAPSAVRTVADAHAALVRSGKEAEGTADSMAVACTQTGLSASRQRAIVKEWCEALPAMANIRFLWLTSKVPQDLFDAACRMPNLEGLYVKWSGITDASALCSSNRLRYLHIGSSTRLRLIEPVASLQDLVWLGLENTKLVRDIEPLRSLTRLEGLYLEGSIWTAQRVQSLAPLGDLASLHWLSLYNVRGKDLSLAPLAALKKLQWLFCPGWFPEDEFKRLLEAKPTMHIQCAGRWYCTCDPSAHD